MFTPTLKHKFSTSLSCASWVTTVHYNYSLHSMLGYPMLCFTHIDSEEVCYRGRYSQWFSLYLVSPHCKLQSLEIDNLYEYFPLYCVADTIGKNRSLKEVGVHIGSSRKLSHTLLVLDLLAANVVSNNTLLKLKVTFTGKAQFFLTVLKKVKYINLTSQWHRKMFHNWFNMFTHWFVQLINTIVQSRN